jgi:amino acid transporter
MSTLSNGAHQAGSPPANRTADERPVGNRDHDGSAARDKFGGLNIGAAFFGWLVAIAIAILLTSIVGAVVAAIGSTTNITQSDAQRSAGTIGVAAGVVLLVVLTVAYFTGGYVAGRMSRYDGARQGVGVWVIGLLVTLVALALGAMFGSQYNILDRVDLPRIPVSTDQLGWGGIITALLVLALTLLGAALGGIVGHRYHNRVDREAYR